MKCQRCKRETSVHTMSMFVPEDICPTCIEKEKKHPMYAEARAKELEAIKRGDLNFAGIGLPDDLVVKHEE